VEEDHRHAVLAGPDPQAVQSLPAQVLVGVEASFGRTPVVLAGPVLAELAYKRNIGAELPAELLRLPRPARLAQPPP
jgi:hypothetical protein